MLWRNKEAGETYGKISFALPRFREFALRIEQYMY